jgi:hypothetical protein
MDAELPEQDNQPQSKHRIESQRWGGPHPMYWEAENNERKANYKPKMNAKESWKLTGNATRDIRHSRQQERLDNSNRSEEKETHRSSCCCGVRRARHFPRVQQTNEASRSSFVRLWPFPPSPFPCVPARRNSTIKFKKFTKKMISLKKCIESHAVIFFLKNLAKNKIKWF